MPFLHNVSLAAERSSTAAEVFLFPNPFSMKVVSYITILVVSYAKMFIPGGFRKEHIPGWRRKWEDLYKVFKNTENSDTAGP